MSTGTQRIHIAPPGSHKSRADENKGLERQIRAFQASQPENRRCADCGDSGPQYVNMTFGAFICELCSSMHRELSHRVKSMCVSQWQSSEVSFLLSKGNKRVNDQLLRRFTGTPPRQEGSDRMRLFIRQKYVEGLWVSNDAQRGNPPAERRPPRPFGGNVRPPPDPWTSAGATGIPGGDPFTSNMDPFNGDWCAFGRSSQDDPFGSAASDPFVAAAAPVVSAPSQTPLAPAKPPDGLFSAADDPFACIEAVSRSMATETTAKQRFDGDPFSSLPGLATPNDPQMRVDTAAPAPAPTGTDLLAAQISSLNHAISSADETLLFGGQPPASHLPASHLPAYSGRSQTPIVSNVISPIHNLLGGTLTLPEPGPAGVSSSIGGTVLGPAGVSSSIRGAVLGPAGVASSTPIVPTPGITASSIEVTPGTIPSSNGGVFQSLGGTSLGGPIQNPLGIAIPGMVQNPPGMASPIGGPLIGGIVQNPGVTSSIGGLSNDEFSVVPHQGAPPSAGPAGNSSLLPLVTPALETPAAIPQPLLMAQPGTLDLL